MIKARQDSGRKILECIPLARSYEPKAGTSWRAAMIMPWWRDRDVVVDQRAAYQRLSSRDVDGAGYAGGVYWRGNPTGQRHRFRIHRHGHVGLGAEYTVGGRETKNIPTSN
jgi:hypothetical protein